MNNSHYVLPCSRQPEQLCSDPLCKIPSIMCKDEKCHCGRPHKFCQRIELSNLIWKLESCLLKNYANYQNHFAKIEELYLYQIAKLQNQLSIFRKQISTLGLAQAEKQLYLKLINHQYQSISSASVFEVLIELNMEKNVVCKPLESFDQEKPNIIQMFEYGAQSIRNYFSFYIKVKNSIPEMMQEFGVKNNQHLFSKLQHEYKNRINNLIECNAVMLNVPTQTPNRQVTQVKREYNEQPVLNQQKTMETDKQQVRLQINLNKLKETKIVVESKLLKQVINNNNQVTAQIIHKNHLGVFSIATNQFNDDLVKQLQKIQSLQSFELVGNKLHDEMHLIINLGASLKRLELKNHNITKSGAKILSELLHLTSLNLDNNRIEAEGTHLISSQLIKLKQLNLNNNCIKTEGAVSISNNLQKLICLQLKNNQIGNQGAAAIANKLLQLQKLDLESNKITLEGAKPIAMNLKKLQHINLEKNNIGQEILSVLASNIKNLKELRLFKINEFQYLKLISETSPKILSLTLQKGTISIGDAALIAEHFEHLEQLNLQNCKISLEAAKVLISKLVNLRSLTIQIKYDVNHQGNDIVLQIANNLKSIQTFNLISNLCSENNKINEKGAEYIANLSNLTYLNLANNNIGIDGIKIISKRLHHLEQLYLKQNNICDQGVMYITKYLLKLIKLDLCNNKVDSEGSKSIGNNLLNLVQLDLSRNQIKSQGMQSIGKNLINLQILVLNENRINFQGAKAIACLLNLVQLKLSSNYVGYEGSKLIVTKLRELQHLTLVTNRIPNEFIPEITKLGKHIKILII